MSNIAHRLRLCLSAREMSIREFQRRMATTGAHGSSYPAIHRALKGGALSLSFVEAAATILQVRPAWLAFGDGDRGDTEAVVSAWNDAAAGLVEQLRRALKGE